jgi:hypothetical protein
MSCEIYYDFFFGIEKQNIFIARGNSCAVKGETSDISSRGILIDIGSSKHTLKRV